MLPRVCVPAVRQRPRYTCRIVGFILAIGLGATSSRAQDALSVGSGAANPGGVAQVPVYVRDLTGTSLGVDAGSGKRIQGFAFKISCSPAAAVTSISFARAGVLQALTPLYERTLQPSAAVAYIGSFAESSNAVGLTLDASPPGDRIGTLSVVLSGTAATGSAVTLTLDPATSTLSNQAGSMTETNGAGTLSLSNGSITVVGATTTTTLSSSVNPSASGQPVTFIASVSSASSGSITGTVAFRDGAATLGTQPLQGGSATYTIASLSQGSHAISAQYSGDTTFASSRSSTLTQTVNVLPFGTPVGVVATAVTTSQVLVTWYAMSSVDHFEIFRAASSAVGYGLVGTTATSGFTDGTVSGGKTYLYYVRAVNTSGTPSLNSAIDAATTIIFTDDPLVPGLSIRALHLAELRTAANAFRLAAGLPAATFTDDTLAGVPIRAAHIQELRTALAAARSALSLPALTYTDNTLTAGATIVKAVHFQELRNGVK